ncbi:putative Odorant receptor 85d, partial [Operophtera brumata]
MLTPLLETLFRRYVLQQEFELLLPFDCAYPIFPFFYKIPCVVLYYASLTLYLINIFHGDMTFDELAHVFSVYVICIQTLYRAAVMFSKKKDIKTIILQLGCIWRTTDLSEEQVMKKNALLKRLNFRFA